MKTLLPLLAALIFSVVNSSDALLFAQQIQASDEALVKNVWDSVQEIVGRLPQWDPENASTIKAWGDSIEKCDMEFASLSGAASRKDAVNMFVGYFGRFGPKADFAWFMAFSRSMVPRDMRPATTSTPNTLQYYLLQIDLAEAQVRLFLKRPDLLARYARMCVWMNINGSKLDFILKNIGKLVESYPDEYWWHARGFVLTCALVSREDFLINKLPDQLHAEILELSAWSKNKALLWDARVMRFYPDFNDNTIPISTFVTEQLHIKSPETPFFDWTGPPPMPAIYFGDFY